jgi:hypothetical protein
MIAKFIVLFLIAGSATLIWWLFPSLLTVVVLSIITTFGSVALSFGAKLLTMGRAVDGAIRSAQELSSETVISSSDVESMHANVKRLIAGSDGVISPNTPVHAAAFATERAGDGSYRKHLGLMSEIRSDFDALTRMLQRPQGNDRATLGVPHIDRIILYIDDLDRCPPKRVVEVLEVIHLLLATDLFVVVVAVDPRWLLRSLQSHYDKILTPTPDEHRTGDSTLVAELEIDDIWTSTPMHYLEKIFQVPFTLHGMTTDCYQNYLKSLAAIAQIPHQQTSTAAPQQPTRPVPHQQASKSTANPAASTPHTPGTGRYPTLEPELSPQAAATNKPADSPTSIRLAEASILQPEEAEFLGLLGPPAISDPRAVKRLLNSYQLLRALHLNDFTSNQYVHRPVGALFGSMIGFPTSAINLFRPIYYSDPQESFADILKVYSKKIEESERPSLLNQELNNLINWLHQLTTSAATTQQPLPSTAGPWQKWIPEVGRYSFIVGRWVSTLPRHHHN